MYYVLCVVVLSQNAKKSKISEKGVHHNYSKTVSELQ